MFAVGEAVEVCSEEEGFVGVWYEAYFVCNNKDMVVVQYKELLTENGDPLQEEVPLRNVRPRPPRILKSSWVNGDLIDAYDRDGWWKGVVSKVLPKNHFLVYFKQTSEEMTFPATLLRSRQEWSNGKWDIITQAWREEEDVPNPDIFPATVSITKERSKRARKRDGHAKGNSVTKRRRPVGHSCKRAKATTNSIKQQLQAQQVEKHIGNDRIDDRKENKNERKNEENGLNSISFSSEEMHAEKDSGILPKEAGTAHTESDVSIMLQTATQAVFSENHHNQIQKNMDGPSAKDQSFYKGMTSRAELRKTCKQAKPRRVELTAYYWLLQAIHVKGPLDWKYEMLLTDARCLLHITNEEHAHELRRVLSSGVYQ